MADRKQINIRVSPGQLENWNEYQSELGFQNRAAMVRRAVEAFYASKTGESEDVNEVLESKLDDIEYRIEQLGFTMSDIREEQLTNDDIDDIAEEVDFRMSRDDLFDSVSVEAEIPPEITEEDTIDIVKEQYITGFAQAVMSIQNKEERERMVKLLEDQWEGIYGHRLDLSEFAE